MDWGSVITAIITTVLGGGVGVLATLKSTRKKAEFAVWQEQLHQMGKELQFERERHKDYVESHRQEVDYLKERNQELVQERSRMRDDYEEQIRDKTARIRESQDREYASNKELAKVQADHAKTLAEYGELREMYAKHRCDIITCPWCEPPKPTTLQKPEGVSKDEWHMQRLTGRAKTKKAKAS